MNQENAHFQYILRLGDTALVLGHRLSEQCRHAPILEEDIAMTNIALDCIGRAEALLKYAGEVEGQGRTEDDLAYKRPERQFVNLLLAEQPNTDFAYVMVRQFLMDAYHFHLYEKLTSSEDATIAGIAAKSLKEAAYHLRHSSNWIMRLGNGTDESHRRIQDALDDLWMYTGDMFEADEIDQQLAQQGIAADLSTIERLWNETVSTILSKSSLQKPEDGYMVSGSRKGIHSEHMGYILAEMQYLQRAYPDAKW